VKGSDDAYLLQVVSATKNYNWDGKNKLEQQWTFAGAMLYSITVITTIGLSRAFSLLSSTTILNIGRGKTQV